MQNDEKTIALIENRYTGSDRPDTEFDFNKAYTAGEMGFKNYLETINGTFWGDGINILIMGSDKKDFQHKRSRADVIMVLRILKSGKILTISIPRDTLITIKEHPKYEGKEDKIGHTLYWGGVDNLKGTVEELLGSPIYKVIIIDNFRTFEAFLAILGGVTVDKYLHGSLGIQWIRNRQFRLGDIERCKRQQLFIKKVFTKGWKITGGGNYFYARGLYRHLRKLIYTDITEDDFLHFLYILKRADFNPNTDLYTGVLPGHFATYDSKILNKDKLSCWKLDNATLERIRFLFYSDQVVLKDVLGTKKIKFSNFLHIELQLILKNVKRKLRSDRYSVQK